MAKIFLRKAHGNCLIPDDEEANEYISKMKLGEVIGGSFSKPRNYEFHKKFFAMLNVGFEAWEPEEKYGKHDVKKDFDVFRQEITIIAGFRYPVARVDGSVKWEAESISFGKMSPERFEKVYSAVADVLLQRILTNYTRDDLDQTVERILGFV